MGGDGCREEEGREWERGLLHGNNSSVSRACEYMGMGYTRCQRTFPKSTETKIGWLLHVVYVHVAIKPHGIHTPLISGKS